MGSKKEELYYLQNLNKEEQILFGQRLLQKGFLPWFLFFFYLIENQHFLFEDNTHYKIFNNLQDVLDLKTIRLIMNLCPRSSKTTSLLYMIAFAFAINSKCQFIYTSYSQDLLADCKKKLLTILSHPFYKLCYMQTFEEQIIETNCVSPWWQTYYSQNHNLKKNKYGEYFLSSNLLYSPQNGKVLFSSLGGSITGFGAGILTETKKFSGALLVDDPNKPGDVNSTRLAEKTYEYFSGTLLSRLNNSFIPLIIMQQRIHTRDLTGLIEENGLNYKKVVCPLENKDGSFNLKYQYTIERINELKKNIFVWASQYQQQPIPLNGNIIKQEYFEQLFSFPSSFQQIFIVCDTAFSVKTIADDSCLMVCGLLNSNLYIIDVKYGKWDFPTLEYNLLELYKEYKNKNFTSIWIENKASGQSLIQTLQKKSLPVLPLYPTTYDTQLKKEFVRDKLTRYYEIEGYLANKIVKISQNSLWKETFLYECLNFDGTGKTKDDFVDCLIYALKIKEQHYNNINWKNLKNKLNILYNKY